MPYSCCIQVGLIALCLSCRIWNVWHPLLGLSVNCLVAGLRYGDLVTLYHRLTAAVYTVYTLLSICHCIPWDVTPQPLPTQALHFLESVSLSLPDTMSSLARAGTHMQARCTCVERDLPGYRCWHEHARPCILLIIGRALLIMLHYKHYYMFRHILAKIVIAWSIITWSQMLNICMYMYVYICIYIFESIVERVHNVTGAKN